MRLKRDKLDAAFSDYIRARARWRCEHCHKQYVPPTRGLQCSHFFGRANKAVRWDPDNAFAHCTKCHTFLGANPQAFDRWARKRLGEKKYASLTLRAHTPSKITPFERDLLLQHYLHQTKLLRQSVA